jgi:hypothetical protein
MMPMRRVFDGCCASAQSGPSARASVRTSPISRMDTSVEDGWRESSRASRRAPAPRCNEESAVTSLVEPARPPDLTPECERLPELDADLGPRLRAPARMEHHAQDAVDAEPRVPEAGVGAVDFAFGPRGSMGSGRQLNSHALFFGFLAVSVAASTHARLVS